MSGAAKPNLEEAVRDYLANPCLANIRKVDAALDGSPTGTALWIALEMATSRKGELDVEKKVNERLSELLKIEASKPVFTNVNQQGAQNAAQTGDGTQSLTGDGGTKK